MTFGAPSRARSGAGQAGDETSKVLPMTPENAVPGLYSLSATGVSFEPMRGTEHEVVQASRMAASRARRR